MSAEIPPWLAMLSEEDWHFIKRFILASGSLKEIAQQYNISYPTVRIRLDRLIEKVKSLDNPRLKSKFHRRIQALAADGKIDISTARAIIRAHEESLAECDSQ